MSDPGGKNPAGPPPARSPDLASPWWTLGAVGSGLALLLIDLFAVNVALPTIGRNFSAGLTLMEWVITAYALMIGVFPVVMARIGDLMGRRRIYLYGLTVFIAASLGCGLAWDIQSLIAFRVLQGLGAAVMMPLSLALVVAAFPRSQRGMAVGVWGGISGLGLIAGPLVGGLLVRGDDWRWIFLINLPIGALAWLATRAMVKESKDHEAPARIDWPGAALLSAGLFAIVLSLSLSRREGWLEPAVLATVFSGVLLLGAFFLWQRRSSHPLIDLGLFRNVTYGAAVISAFLFSAAVFGGQPFISLLLQHTWGFTPMMGGLAFLPATALVALTLPLGGWLGGRLGSRLWTAIVGGSLLVTASALLQATLSPSSGYLSGLLPILLMRGMGIGIVISASSLAAMNALPEHQAGLASGILTMARQVGTAWGISLLGSAYLSGLSSALTSASRGLRLEGGALDAGVLEALRSFRPIATSEPVQRQSLELIFSGFTTLSLATAGLCLAATLAAGFIRFRSDGAPSGSMLKPGQELEPEAPGA